MNRFQKALVGASVAVTAVVAGATAAFAAVSPTYDPGAEATSVANANWPMLLDMVKDLAPIAIGAGLVLLAIRKVVGSIRRGKAPTA